jgi:prepilin-type N-terminal cleavage/methylation domain-containing protein
MSYLRTDKGFTLVELVIVLAISALLLAGIVAGQGAIQEHTAFSSAIDSARLQLKEVQNEATQSVAAQTTSTSGASDETDFGKLVEFDNSTPASASQMKTWTLVEDAAKTTLYKCDEEDITIGQGVNFINATNGATTSNTEAVIFGRNPNQTYVDPDFVDPQGSTVPSECSPSASPAPTVPTGPSTPCVLTRTQSNPQGSCPPPPPPPPPPAPCNNNPGWQCGLYGQYYTGAIADASRTEDSAYIDQGIGEDAAAVQSWPSFLPVLANRTITPPTNVSVHWSGQILIGTNDFPKLTSHTYCIRDSNIGDITIAGVTATGPPTPCVTVTPSDLASGAGWYPISIDFQTASGAAPFVQLYEQDAATGNAIVEVPGGTGGDLETAANAQLMSPASAFVNGLYGQYYSDGNFDNRVSAYTDPLIGDSGTQFSFDNASPNNDVFSPKLEWNTAKATTDNDSVKWTGQILVDTTGPQTYCITGANGVATLIIDGSQVLKGTDVPNPPNFNTGTLDQICTTTGSLTAGWHNLEYDYVTTGSSSPRSLRLGELVGGSGGTYQDIPHDHLRRPLDWSATGSQGTCKSGDTDCEISGSDIQENSSSSGNCSSSNQRGVFNFSKTGLTPDSTYKMDLSYFNAPDSQDLPVPNDYYYEVCVSVNGTLMNGGSPIDLPISEPSINPRTYTMSGITVPTSGNITISLDWLNDAYQSGFSLGYYDANFAVSRLDLYRSLNASGILSDATPATTTSTAPKVAAASSANLAARLFGLLLPSADAAAACDTNVLNLQNYTLGCFGAGPTSTLNLQVAGQAENGYIDISTQDNSIERRITN